MLLIGVYALMATDNLLREKNLSYAYLDVLAQYYTSPHSNTSAGYEHNLKKMQLRIITRRGRRIKNIIYLVESFFCNS